MVLLFAEERLSNQHKKQSPVPQGESQLSLPRRQPPRIAHLPAFGGALGCFPHFRGT